jgi:hypothetical protein
MPGTDGEQPDRGLLVLRELVDEHARIAFTSPFPSTAT